MTERSVQQAADIAEARAEFEFRGRQLEWLADDDRFFDRAPWAGHPTLAKYIEARDAYMKLVGAL